MKIFKNYNPQQNYPVLEYKIDIYFPDINILVGKKVAFVTNLQPRMMMGLESNGMILAVNSGDNFALMEVPENIPEGTKFK